MVQRRLHIIGSELKKGSCSNINTGLPTPNISVSNSGKKIKYKHDDRSSQAIFVGRSRQCKHSGCIDESAWKVSVLCWSLYHI